jgi:tRNA 2-thiouridine synthesizing protein B
MLCYLFSRKLQQTSKQVIMSRHILHTVNQSPFTSETLAQCLLYCGDHDAILLLENGVYGALKSHALATQMTGKTCYVMTGDLQARGLLEQGQQTHIQLIDMHRFVELATQYDLVQSWY